MHPDETGRKPKADLTSYQSAFLNSFRRQGSPRCHLLVAPPGLGKTQTAAILAAECVQSEPNGRVLVLAPAPLVSMWTNALSERVGHTSVHRIDRKRFRELESEEERDQRFWPNGISLLSDDTAKRDEIAGRLSTSDWILVIYDEAHRGSGQRGQLMEQLQRSNSVRRILLLTATPTFETHGIRPDCEATDWTPEMHTALQSWLRADDGSRRLLLRYQRAPSEVRFLRELLALSQEQEASGATKARPAAIGIRLHMASSSILAFSERWQSLAFPHPETDPDRSLSPEESDWGLHTHQEVGNLESAARARQPGQTQGPLLGALEDVHEDGKLAALQALLSRLVSRRESPRICILTMYQSTAEYLRYGDIVDAGIPCHVLTSRLDVQSRERAISEYLEGGGVLIGTDASTRGLSIASPTDVIHYDLPLSARSMLARRSLYASSPADIAVEHAFRDESQILPVETELLKLHGWEV